MDQEETFRLALIDLTRSVIEVVEQMQKADPGDIHAQLLLAAANTATNVLYRALPQEIRDQYKDE